MPGAAPVRMLRVPAPVLVGRRRVQEAAEPRRVGLADRLLPARVQRAERVAVIRAPPRDDRRAGVVAASQVVRARHLDRRLDRLAPARHRIDARVVHRQVRRQLVGVGLERLGREHRAVDVLGLVQLLGRRIDQRAIAVAHVDDDRAAGSVQVALAVRVDDPRALGRTAVGSDRLNTRGKTWLIEAFRAAGIFGPIGLRRSARARRWCGSLRHGRHGTARGYLV